MQRLLYPNISKGECKGVLYNCIENISTHFKKTFIALLAIGGVWNFAFAQSSTEILGIEGAPINSDQTSRIVISPLFEYPIAPEEFDGLQEKSDWLMEHFWDGMDFMRRESVDQNALNDAFNVYASAAMYASKAKVHESIANLIKKLKGNPVLMLQFTKGAEEVFYGPRAVAWIDEIFTPFLKGVMAEKNISSTRKLRYKELLEMLERNAVGHKLPTARLTSKNGLRKEFIPKADFTLIEFGNPDCDDCKFARTKLEFASDLMEMVNNKELEIVFIVADSMPEEEREILNKLAEYPTNWTVGIIEGGDDIYDLRLTPSFYILNKKGEIVDKNLDVSEAVRVVRDLKALKK